MYILIKEYGSDQKQIIEHSDEPFRIEDINLDYTSGLTYVQIGKTINLPGLKDRILFDRKAYLIANPLTEDEKREKIKDYKTDILISVENGEKYKLKKPVSNYIGFQTYEGEYYVLVNRGQTIIPLVDIVNGRYMPGFSERAYKYKPFSEVIGNEDNNPNRKIVSDEYILKKAELEKEDAEQQENREVNSTEQVEKTKSSIPKRRR